MLVNITEQNIYEGIREDPWLCPIALAIRGQDNVATVSVLRSAITVHRSDGHYESYGISDGCLKFMKDFDLGEPVSPIVLELYPIGAMRP